MKLLLPIGLMTALALSQANAQTTPLVDTILQAANSGDVTAQAKLGQHLIDGQGVLQDYAAAAGWLTLAAEAGNISAANNLGKLYYEGLGVPKDRQAGLGWLEKAAQNGDAQMLYDLATALESSSQEADLKRAFDLYSRGAAAGHIPSTVNLGVMYQTGNGGLRDLARAKELYEIAARNDEPRALNNLGLLYVRGDGVTQDYAHAAELFTRAAETGMRPALRNLGVLYENGFGVSRDKKKADALYRLASNGEADSRTSLEFAYDPRLALPDTTPTGITAIHAAAEASDPIAQFQAGWILATQKDAGFLQWQHAFKLFEAAAQRGHGPAMANLSFMYFRGLGVPQDFVFGQMWLLLAKYSGADTAALDAAFANTPTRAQINDAQARAKKIREEISSQKVKKE